MDTIKTTIILSDIADCNTLDTKKYAKNIEVTLPKYDNNNIIVLMFL